MCIAGYCLLFALSIVFIYSTLTSVVRYNVSIEYIIMSFIATTVRNTVEYSAVVVRPHSSYITISMNAIKAYGQFKAKI